MRAVANIIGSWFRSTVGRYSEALRSFHRQASPQSRRGCDWISLGVLDGDEARKVRRTGFGSTRSWV